MIDSQIYARSQGLAEKDLLYIVGPAKRTWAIRSQHSHTKGSLYSLSNHSSSAHSSALLALKQKAEFATSLYIRRWDCR